MKILFQPPLKIQSAIFWIPLGMHICFSGSDQFPFISKPNSTFPLRTSTHLALLSLQISHGTEICLIPAPVLPAPRLLPLPLTPHHCSSLLSCPKMYTDLTGADSTGHILWKIFHLYTSDPRNTNRQI